MSIHYEPSPVAPPVMRTLLPIMITILAGFLIIGVALPVLPLYVNDELGFGSLMVGLVAGAQFMASLISRIWAGAFADRHGAKQAVIAGLLAAVGAGLLYLLSLLCITSPIWSVCLLLVGRAVLGGAESFIITGGIAWGLSLVPAQQAGKAIAWVGTAMFAAMALGGPIGSVAYATSGFGAIALITALLPLVILPWLSRLPGTAIKPHTDSAPVASVMQAVWLPGVGAALASIGYCAILAFSSLYFARMHWQPVWSAFTAFGLALILARALAGHLPDRLGGPRVAMIFALVQVAGLLLMWQASSMPLATAGALLAGCGYSLVYPGFGVVAVSRVSPQRRGLAMGIFTAFLDVAMALGSPALGWVGSHAGLATIFLVSALAVMCAAGIGGILSRKSTH